MELLDDSIEKNHILRRQPATTLKRLHIPFSAHHVSFGTINHEEHFSEDVFCQILIDSIEWTEIHRDCTIIGWKINPDHIHLIIQVHGTYTISEIMHCIKRVSSIRINQVIYEGTEWRSSKLKVSPEIFMYYRFIQRKYGAAGTYTFDRFKWQTSFYDKIMESPTQLKNTIVYIKAQSEHHGLDFNHFLFVRKAIPNNIHFPKLRKHR